jgi:guanine nucleotide-binding protein G(i) subunit alpha
MKIIHKDGFTEEERNSYKTIIFNNTVSAMRTLISAARDLGVTIENQVTTFRKVHRPIVRMLQIV